MAFHSYENIDMDNLNRLRFPDKLHTVLGILDHYGPSDIIGWNPDGLSFRIFKPDEFASTIMPIFFKQQTKYKSFQRQLSVYGFQRIVASSSLCSIVLNGSYHHKCFVKSDPSLCKLITRKRQASETTYFPPKQSDVKKQKELEERIKWSAINSQDHSQITTLSQTKPHVLLEFSEDTAPCGMFQGNASWLPEQISSIFSLRNHEEISSACNPMFFHNVPNDGPMYQDRGLSISEGTFNDCASLYRTGRRLEIDMSLFDVNGAYLYSASNHPSTRLSSERTPKSKFNSTWPSSSQSLQNLDELAMLASDIADPAACKGLDFEKLSDVLLRL